MENIKIGIVSDVNYERAAVKVAFEDRDNKVSRELPVIFPFVSKNKAYALPEINEQVLCVFLNKEYGFCIGSFYDANNTPDGKKEIHKIQFGDKLKIEYNSVSNTLDITGAGTVNIGGTVNISGDFDAGKMQITGGKIVIKTDVKISGNLEVGDITSGDIASGRISAKGDITATGRIIDTGGNTSNHTHR